MPETAGTVHLIDDKGDASQTADTPDVILLLDDEKDVRQTLDLILNDEYECVQAADTKEAREILKMNNVALVISDISMPGENGLEFLPYIIKHHRDTAIIMVTGVNQLSTGVEALKIGAYDYLTKPFQIDEIKFSVNHALERRRLILENREYRLHLEDKVASQTIKIKELTLSAMESMVLALEAKDRYTNGHSKRVAASMVAIGKVLNPDDEFNAHLRLGGQLHDIGKIGVRESVLNKPGSLTPGEYEHLKMHPILGEKIISPISGDYLQVKIIIRNHHERIDGKGFPDRMKGDEIPLEARIAAVSDSFDAMTSLRPYRPALTKERAFQEIQDHTGTQFDPEIAKIFLNLHGA